MIGLFTDYSLDTVNTFLVSGAILGALYYSALAILSRLSILLSRDGIITLVKCSYKEFNAFVKNKKSLKLNVKLFDLIRAMFIFFIGVFFLLLNYVFVNGTLRIYLIISLTLGIYLSKIISGSKIYLVAIDQVFHFCELLIFVFFYPIKLFYRILTKKRAKNYSTPPI